MSMIENDEPLSAECSVCDVIAFEPQRCAECGPGTGLLCADCRRECPTCGETMCYDHFDAKATHCGACDRRDAIESGEAMREWARSRDY